LSARNLNRWLVFFTEQVDFTLGVLGSLFFTPAITAAAGWRRSAAFQPSAFEKQAGGQATKSEQKKHQCR
jgi:hypothetical protein